MKEIGMEEIVKFPYSENAIIRKGTQGFEDDFLILYCLIRRYKPGVFMEIGTSIGLGTRIICRAMEDRPVYSIDLPPGTDPETIYPGHEDGMPTQAGVACDRPYTQLYGNSMDFDFAPYYPIDGWFIDAKHSFPYVKNDTEKALQSNPVIIIWHDMDIPGVFEGAVAAIKDNDQYLLYRVLGTRMGFAIRKDCEIV